MIPWLIQRPFSERTCGHRVRCIVVGPRPTPKTANWTSHSSLGKYAYVWLNHCFVISSVAVWTRSISLPQHLVDSTERAFFSSPLQSCRASWATHQQRVICKAYDMEITSEQALNKLSRQVATLQCGFLQINAGTKVRHVAWHRGGGGGGGREGGKEGGCFGWRERLRKNNALCVCVCVPLPLYVNIGSEQRTMRQVSVHAPRIIRVVFIHEGWREKKRERKRERAWRYKRCIPDTNAHIRCV